MTLEMCLNCTSSSFSLFIPTSIFPSFVPQFLLFIHQFIYPLIISCSYPSAESLPCLRYSAWTGFHRTVQIFTSWGTVSCYRASTPEMSCFSTPPPLPCASCLRMPACGLLLNLPGIRCSRLHIFAWWKLSEILIYKHTQNEAKCCGVSSAGVSERQFQK